MLSDINQIRGFVYGTGSQPDAANAAADLVTWSKQMATLFPLGPTTADYVDMSPERVKAAPAVMNSTAQALLAAVGTGNRTAIGDQLARTEQQGCGSCHLSSSR